MKRILPVILCVCFCLSVHGQKPPLPTGIVPDGLGYNIHFTHAKPGEMEMIADSGATIVRMDFHWGGTEREKGVYDFKAFEHLTDSLEKHKIRPLYILDYSNRHYDGGLSPHSEEGRTAFADWAAAAAVHFKDRGILWEMYNEPNIQFWKPKPDPEKYILLALEVGRALRQAAPNELYIGPGTAQSPVLHTIDFPFLEQCFKAGLLEYWDAVSVHPYRQSGPETVLKEYAQLRYLIDKYAPKEPDAQRSGASGLKHIPILSGEWGYSSVWHNFDDEKQGKMLPRQWMINLAMDVPISIWYDWHDDGQDPKEPEHHFGTVNHEYLKDQNPVYKPKDSYTAAKTFNETFKGFRFNKRIWTGDDEVFVFLFDNQSTTRKLVPNTETSTNTLADASCSVKIAAWTTSKKPKEITIPSVPGKFEAVSYLGEKLPELIADENGLKLTVTDGPVYLTPKDSDGFWNNLAKLKSKPLALFRDFGPGMARVFMIDGFDHLPSFPLWEVVDGIKVFQHTYDRAAKPVIIGRPFPDGNDLVIFIDNPSGEGLSKQRVEIKQIKGFELAETIRFFEFEKGEKSLLLRFPFKTKPTGKYRCTVQGPEEYFHVMSCTCSILDDFSKYGTESLNKTWSVVPDGDAKIASEQKIEIDDGKLKLTFKYADGWKFVRIFPKDENVRRIENSVNGKPKALAFQVQGDGTPVSINVRYRDSKGQTFQVHGAHLRDDSVQSLEFPLNGGRASHWGGPNDGVIHYPIQLDSIVVDGTRKACGPGTVTFSSPVVIYE